MTDKLNEVNDITPEFKYGWTPDAPDDRDFLMSFTSNQMIDLPESVDLRDMFTFVFSQLSLGSCTANAISQALIYEQNKRLGKGVSKFVPSRLFIYFNERLMEGNVGYDSGATLRTGMKCINGYGVCDEALLEYDVTKFTIRPSDECYSQAMDHQSLVYARISQDEISLKTCLASGYPFVFGFTIYDSFETPAVKYSGIVPMPNIFTERKFGGHAVLCVGFNDKTRMFTVLNSWGDQWGDKGYFYLPYDYLTNYNLAGDFWNVSLSETNS